MKYSIFITILIKYHRLHKKLILTFYYLDVNYIVVTECKTIFILKVWLLWK